MVEEEKKLTEEIIEKIEKDSIDNIQLTTDNLRKISFNSRSWTNSLNQLINQLQEILQEKTRISYEEKKLTIEKYNEQIKKIKQENHLIIRTKSILSNRINSLKEKKKQTTNIFIQKDSLIWFSKQNNTKEKIEKAIIILKNINQELNDLKEKNYLEELIEIIQTELKPYQNIILLMQKLAQNKETLLIEQKKLSDYNQQSLRNLHQFIIILEHFEEEKQKELGLNIKKNNELINELNEQKSKFLKIETFTENKKKRFVKKINTLKNKLAFKYHLKLNNNSNILLLGIPTSLNSGVNSVVKEQVSLMRKKKLNVCIITHWWHNYFFFNKSGNYKQIISKNEANEKKKHYEKVDEGGKFSKVNLSPFNILDSRLRPIMTEFKWSGKQSLNFLIKELEFFPKIIHAHTHTFEYDNALDIIQKLSGNKPVIYTVHAFIPLYRANQEERNLIYNKQITNIKEFRVNKYRSKKELSQEKMFEKADKILFISEAHKEPFDYLYKEYKHKSRVLNNPINIFELKNKINSEDIKKLKDKLKINQNKIITYSGRLEKKKGISRLCEAFNQLKREGMRELKLMLIGAMRKNSDEKVKNNIINKLNKIYKLDKKFNQDIIIIPWLNNKKELATFYLSSDIVIMPGISKNLYSLAALEALSLGVPIISTEGKFEIISSSRTWKEIYYGIKKFYQEPEKYLDLANKKSEEVKKNYSEETYYKTLIKIYNEALKEKDLPIIN